MYSKQTNNKDINSFQCVRCKNTIFTNKNIGSNHLKYAILCFSVVCLNLLIELLISDNKNKNAKILQNTLRLTSHFNILVIFYIFNNHIFNHQATTFDIKFEKFGSSIYTLLFIYFSIMCLVNILEYKSNSIINYEQMQFIQNKDLILLTHTFLGLVTIQNLYHVSNRNNTMDKFIKKIIQ